MLETEFEFPLDEADDGSVTILIRNFFIVFCGLKDYLHALPVEDHEKAPDLFLQGFIKLISSTGRLKSTLFDIPNSNPVMLFEAALKNGSGDCSECHFKCADTLDETDTTWSSDIAA